MKALNLEGQRFTRLTVLRRVENNKKGQSRWLCKCDCGKEVVVAGHYLKSGNTKSCGCYRREKTQEARFNDLTGKKFGRLLVLERTENRGKATTWKCLCDCGNFTRVTASRLVSGETKSCGCIHKEMMHKKFYKHGGSSSKLVSVWRHMIARCYDKIDPEYNRYGARGISICDEWKEYGNFYRWAISAGYDENAERGNCTLDRVDNNGNYEPQNCRFVSMKVQSNNRRSNRIIDFNGESHTVSEWAEIIGIRPSALSRRINALGWSVEQALTTPKCKNQHG